jgi:hypothetical protein
MHLARVYAQRYPETREPSDMIFKRLEGQLRANWPPVNLSKQRIAMHGEHEIAFCQFCWRRQIYTEDKTG